MDKKWKDNGYALSPAETGVEYCSRLALVADRKGQLFLGLGIAMGIVATGAAVAGAAMGPGDAGTGWASENRNTLVVASGGILAIPTTILLMRSKNASNASGSASSGIALADSAAMETCLKARAEWTNSRATAAEVAQKKFTEAIDARMKLIDEAEEEKKTKEEEAAAAAKANTPGAEAEALGEVREIDERIEGLEAEVVDLMRSAGARSAPKRKLPPAAPGGGATVPPANPVVPPAVVKPPGT